MNKFNPKLLISLYEDSHRYPLNSIILLVFFCDLGRNPRKRERVEREARLEKCKDCEREKVFDFYYSKRGISLLSAFYLFPWRSWNIFRVESLQARVPLESGWWMHFDHANIWLATWPRYLIFLHSIQQVICCCSS